MLMDDTLKHSLADALDYLYGKGDDLDEEDEWVVASGLYNLSCKRPDY